MKDLSLHILDISQNSIRAGARNIGISIVESAGSDTLVIDVSDDGSGMTREVLDRVTDPYYTSRTTRKVGLGIPLFKQNAEATGGMLQLMSETGKGTTLTATFGLSHIDRPPLGDLAGVIVMLAGANPGIRFVYRHKVEAEEFVFDTSEIAGVLGEVPVSEPQVMRFLKEMIKENLEALWAQ